MMQFELPQEESSIIKVIGVGGGGSNAVNHMFRLGIKGVDFIICNTDKQALEKSPVPHKIQLGHSLTRGLGAGAKPEVGRDSALESIEDIKNLLKDNTEMVFITAGLGGGTGTGAAPVIASIAKELGILTVGIVTIPFSFEGKKRREQAEKGLEEMKKYVDTLIVIGNDKLREIYGSLKMTEAFAHADNVLTSAAKSIAEIISLHMHVNVDFNDVKTVMQDSGVAIMGSAIASGEKRALRAVENALISPLLNDNDISGARHVLLNIMSGSDDIEMDEFGEITDFIQEAAGGTAELITGYGTDPSLGDNVSVTIIATGFNSKMNSGYEAPSFQERKIVRLDEPTVTKTEPVQTSIIDEIQKEEPFIFTKTEEEPIAKIENTIAPIVNEIKEEEKPAFKVYSLDETPETPVTFTNETVNQEFIINDISDETFNSETIQAESNTREEQIRLAQERIKKLKELTLKMKTPEGLAHLEKESAWQRKQVNLDNNSTTPSTDSQVSRYTLGENNEIRPNNSFLHDNVD
ncbi:MAG: cell division protein FtsZ [Bacteroidetes bacterium]|jgi:cell division protein FtsZ|nr:cell division protein FtsZ [Bacteroidota bacterium]